MDDPLQIAEVVRQACLEAALRAYEDAGLGGLCHEGRWECAVDAIRAMPLRPLLQGLIEGQGDGGPRRHPPSDRDPLCPPPPQPNQEVA
jgi:hypothetical protein